jgi:hypothetical protein
MKLKPADIILARPRRQLLANASLLAGSVVAASFVPSIAQAQTPLAGKEYRLIEPVQPTDNAAKIEVAEFFWYGADLKRMGEKASGRCVLQESACAISRS